MWAKVVHKTALPETWTPKQYHQQQNSMNLFSILNENVYNKRLKNVPGMPRFKYKMYFVPLFFCRFQQAQSSTYLFHKGHHICRQHFYNFLFGCWFVSVFISHLYKIKCLFLFSFCWNFRFRMLSFFPPYLKRFFWLLKLKKIYELVTLKFNILMSHSNKNSFQDSVHFQARFLNRNPVD